MWADDVTLFTTNFSTADGWISESIITSNTTSATKTIKGTTISFKGYKSSDLTVKVGDTDEANGTLTFTGNNLSASAGDASSANYYMAIPVKNVNGSITVTTTGAATKWYYTYDDGNAGTVVARQQASANGGFTITDLENTNVTIYIGSSGKTLNSITITTPAATVPYTVTFEAGSNGSCSTASLTEASVGSGVTLPSVTAKSHYTFKGWATTEGATTADAGEAGDTYNPSSDCTLYAVYECEYASTVLAKWDATNPIGTFTYEGDATDAQTLKIHTNTDEVKCVKFGSGMISNNTLTNYMKVTVDGGFKKGDVISFSGAYNNTSEKVATIAFATSADNVLCVSGSCINGRLVSDNPTIEYYTLTNDADELYIGRDVTGKTSTYLTSFVVTRGDKITEPTINANGYGTFSSQFNAAITGANVYKATLSGTTITCTKIESGIVPAGTGVLLYKEGVTEATTATALYTDAADAIEDNDLLPTTLADGSLAAKVSSLVLSGNTFMTFTGTTFSAGKAYFEYTATPQAKFNIVFDDETATAINAVETVKAQSNAAYNLAGQRVNANAKGIVIVNGKKYINK